MDTNTSQFNPNPPQVGFPQQADSQTQPYPSPAPAGYAQAPPVSQPGYAAPATQYAVAQQASMQQTPPMQQPAGYGYAPVQLVYQQQQVKQPSGWARLWGAFALAFVVLVVQAFAFIFGIVSATDEGMMTVGEVVGGVVALLFVLALGGKMLATPSMKGMGETWRIVRWLFLADAVVAVIDIVSVVIDGSFELAELWPLRIILIALMCMGIGLFEETTFRGLIFHGLLSRMGTNQRGIFWAIMISSILFGLAHIDPTSMSFSDPSQVIQALLKILQTGIFGFVAAVAVLETGNLWPVMLVHGLNDFMLMFVSNGLMPSPVTTEYVSSGEEGLLTIGVYLVLCVAYLPSVVAAVRTLRKHQAPDRGQFYRARQTYTMPPTAGYQPTPY